MSDDGNGGLQVRQSPRTRSGDVRIADLTMMVRVAGQPAAIRVFTDDEADEAARYAAEVGGTIVPLPLSPPTAYTERPNGSLISLAPSSGNHPAVESSPDGDVT